MGTPEPAPDCARCPRLVAHRAVARARHPDGHNAAVPSMGDPAAHLLIVGLAPGMDGANRTGRPFTGDASGVLLHRMLAEHGLLVGERLTGCMVTNAVRCLPPANRPSAAEIAACRPFLAARIAALPRLERILALGRIAHEAVLRALGARPAALPFAHEAEGRVAGLKVVASYHCSRYNVNTGRLTESMFRAVFARLMSRCVDGLPPAG